MFFKPVLLVVTMVCVLCESSDVFHVKSMIPCHPSINTYKPAYFGYTVVLTNTSLLVGAPKSIRLKDTMSTGAVYKCEFNAHVFDFQEVSLFCQPMVIEETEGPATRIIRIKDFFRNDMWFGASIATIPEGKFMACAPRWAEPYSDKHLLASGACYVETKRQGKTLTPLTEDNYNLAFKTDGVRKEYGEYGTHLNFYAYGQAGMSLKVTENNSIIIGAPGLLQWTGGVVGYRYSPSITSSYFSKLPITNPYYTNELGPDDYFGYSVESGIFEINGSTLYVAGAPRSSTGYGKVLVFEPAIRVADPLRIRAKVRGPQLGAYFGASLCCTDVNGDGRADLMVGAPNYVTDDVDTPYDQGAVFIYLATEESGKLVLQEAGFIAGGAESGARFGSTIAALGDIDGDGYNDIAVGAPWEMNGAGAVYIYRGGQLGLQMKYTQRITAAESKGFGISISRGVDIDGNDCNDFAVGAHESGLAHIFRCIPTIKVHASINVPDAMNLPKNITKFSASFCVTVQSKPSWRNAKIDLQANITIDPEENRAFIASDSEFTVTAMPGRNVCEEQEIEVKPTADLSKPILMVYDLKPKEPVIDDLKGYKRDAARLSEDSSLHTTFLLQLIRDCGDDLICIPFLEMTLEALNSKYVPGSNDSLGVKVSVVNTEEPAYAAKVFLPLPLPPKRVPGSCSLVAHNMTCDLPNPLGRGKSVDFEIELEYTSKAPDEDILNITAELILPVNSKNSSEATVRHVNIKVVPKADFRIVGKVLPNKTIVIAREKFDEAENIAFSHYFEITNLGPSDWSSLEATIDLPENMSLTGPVNGCDNGEGNLRCKWSLPAKRSLSVSLALGYDLKEFGKYLEELSSVNSTTNITLLLQEHQWMSVTTIFSLDPATPIWHIIVGYVVGSIGGFLLLAAIVYGLHRFGFFSREKHWKLTEESSSGIDGESSSGPSRDESAEALDLDLLETDSDAS